MTEIGARPRLARSSRQQQETAEVKDRQQAVTGHQVQRILNKGRVNEMPIKVTQTVSEVAAEVAYQHLAATLDCPPSRILERLLLALPADDLLALAQGRLSMSTTKTISLDAESLLAVRAVVADSISLLSGRVADAAKDGARQGAHEAIDVVLDRDI